MTDAGRKLLESAEPTFGHLARADATVNQLAGQRAQQVRLAAFATACSTVLPLAIAAAREEDPDVEISLIEAEPNDGARALTGGTIDLAIGYAYPAVEEPDDRALEHALLFEDRLRLLL